MSYIVDVSVIVSMFREGIAMSDMSNQSDIVYKTLKVSEILNVKESTLRKYCTLMQKNNYVFSKNSSGHRVFYEKDIQALRDIIDVKNYSQLTVAEAVENVLSDTSDISHKNTDETTDVSESYNKLLQEFSAFKAEQQRFNQQLLKQIEEQQNYIKNAIDERDHKLLLSMKENQEAKRQTASSQEKPRWWQFWK